MSRRRRLLLVLIGVFLVAGLLISIAVTVFNLHPGSKEANVTGGNATGTVYDNVSFKLSLVREPPAADLPENPGGSFRVKSITLYHNGGNVSVNSGENVSIQELASGEVQVAKERIVHRSYNRIELHLDDFGGETAGGELMPGASMASEGYYLFNSTRPEYVFHMGPVNDDNRTYLKLFQGYGGGA